MASTRQVGTANIASASEINMTWPLGAPLEDSLIVAFVMYNDTKGLTWPAGTWTEETAPIAVGGDGSRVCCVHSLIAGASEPATYNWDVDGSDVIGAVAYELVGYDRDEITFHESVVDVGNPYVGGPLTGTTTPGGATLYLMFGATKTFGAQMLVFTDDDGFADDSSDSSMGGTNWSLSAHSKALTAAKPNVTLSIDDSGDGSAILFGVQEAGGAPPDEADLGVTKSDSADPVIVGNEFSYTVTVTNDGPDTATGVTVVDTLPGEVLYVSSTPSQGSCSELNGVVTCDLGSILNGADATVTITVDADTTGLASNSVTVSGDTTDTNAANDTAVETTQINPVPVGESGTIDLTGTDHLQDLRLNPQIKVQGGRVADRAARQMFSKFAGLERGLLVRAWYSAGWQVTPYPGTDTMTVDETIEATFLWRGGDIGDFEDDIGGLVAALTTEGYTAYE